MNLNNDRNFNLKASDPATGIGSPPQSFGRMSREPERSMDPTRFAHLSGAYHAAVTMRRVPSVRHVPSAVTQKQGIENRAYISRVRGLLSIAM
jgi:hypothetical protein